MKLQQNDLLDQYNQPNDANDTYRYLKHYFIYIKGDKSKKRITLPIIQKRDTGIIVIVGYLQPSPSSEIAPKFVIIEHNIQALASIDFSSLNRGYWIQTNSPPGWYYLQEPCDSVPSGGTKCSQAEVQWDTTVTLTCISALLDQKLNVVKSIQETLPMLLPTDKCPDEKVLLAGFELGIIASYKATIHQHMLNCNENCTETCKLMKSIDKLKKPTHVLKTTAVQLWVQLICIQLQRHIWGGELAVKATTPDNGLPEKRKNSNPVDESRNVRPKISNVVAPIKIEADVDIFFSAVKLKEQLQEARIPNILYNNIVMDEWNKDTSWESIVREHESSCRFGTDIKGDVEKFFDHIMEVKMSDMINENMVLAIFALSRLETTSKSYGLLLKHMNKNNDR